MSTSTQVRTVAAPRVLPWPKRFDIALLGFLAQVIAYCDRVNLSVAAPMISTEYGWTPAQMGWVLSGFFWGYMLLMIPMGYIVDRFGPKRTLGAGMAWWSLVTLLTPFCRTVPAMAGSRVLIGMGESGTIPSINGMLVRWFPPAEYSRVAGFCWGGGFAGAIVAFPLASAIAAGWGWRAIFAVFSVLGLLWLPFWLLGTSDRPSSGDGAIRVKPTRLDLRKLFRHRAVWSLFALHFSSNWYVYVLASWLPTYLLSHRGFSLSEMAFGTSLPFLGAFIGTNTAGNLIDRLTNQGNRARIRKLFLVPSFLGTATLLIVPVAATPVWIVAALFLSMFLHGFGTPVQASNSMDLAPRSTGTLVGFQNCFANLAGISAPVVTGYLVQSTGWLSVFWLTTAVGLAGIGGFMLFGKTEPIID
jgi:MFS transporter, ACS family, D-galactonate transporter